MKKTFVFVTLLIATHCFSQTGSKVSFFLLLQANKTLYDRTITNNSAGPGFGLQTLLNTNTFVKPTLEINGDLFAGTKELYLTSEGKPIYGKSGVLNIYAGPLISLTNRIFVTTTTGISIYNNDVHFGVRPSIGAYPTKSKKWAVKTSFTNVFQRDNISNEDFGYLSFALKLKL